MFIPATALGSRMQPRFAVLQRLQKLHWWLRQVPKFAFENLVQPWRGCAAKHKHPFVIHIVVPLRHVHNVNPTEARLFRSRADL